jgi:hypothetical protein
MKGVLMRSLLAVAGLALCSSSALAVDFGIGIAARSTDDGWLYVPVDVSEHFRFEPTFRYASEERDDGLESSDIREFGLGVFGLKQLTEAGQLYFGARAAYVKSEELYYVNSVARVRIKSDGYSVAPTAGVEFLFGGHFSVGGEVAYSFEQLDSKLRGWTATPSVEQDSHGTQTRFIVRYMF